MSQIVADSDHHKERVDETSEIDGIWEKYQQEMDSVDRTRERSQGVDREK